MNQVYLQLGSNLGAREIFLQTARDFISKELGLIEKISKIYESTSIDPHDLLKLILTIEKKIGRIRIEKWGERVIDIDILFYNDDIIETIDLCIPHKYLSKRRFVLMPLCEIAENLNHPKHNKTILELFNECIDEEKVEIYDL